MMKNNYCATTVLLALLLCQSQTAFANWGYEAHRADDGDVADLSADWVRMQMSLKRIKNVTSNALQANQRAVLEGGYDEAKSPHEVVDAVYEWWSKEVLGPAIAIAGNPAATCDEATLATRRLLEYTSVRQRLGMDVDNPRDAQLIARMGDLMALSFGRCREEAFDECAVSGRYRQVIEQAFLEGHQTAVIGKLTNVEEWAKDALKQCANYELRFSSTSKISQGGMMVEKSYTSKIVLMPPEKIDLSNVEFYGQTHGNITDVSLNCTMPKIVVVCKPGAEIDSGFKAWVRKMDMNHREFYMDEQEIVKTRLVGEDKLPLELSGDAQTVMMFMKLPTGQEVQVPWSVSGLAFMTAHMKDSVLPGMPGNVKIERKTRGGYPVLFEFTYADSGNMQALQASDSTVFKLVHTPHIKPYPPRERAPKTPHMPHGGVQL